MEKGTLLLASSGKEFVKPTGILASSSEVKKARREAMGRLGLDFLDSVDGTDEMDIEKELAGDEADQDVDMEPSVKAEEVSIIISPYDGPPDIKMKEPSPPARSLSTTPAAPSPAASGPSAADDTSALSARERNRLKRKRKPGNSAFVAAPPPAQGSGAKYNANAAGPSKCV